jgi:anti-sigma regulatory factor (Ser/Thr protein kinase)
MGLLYEADFEPNLGSVAAARGLARAALSEWGLDSDDVVIAVSELASNAVRHAGTAYRVRIEHSGGTVTVTVSDSRPETTSAGSPSLRNGRGLKMVNELALEWGVRPKQSGKAYWALFDPPRWSEQP